MSVVQFPDALDSSADLQVWNNAAFDNGENSEDFMGSRQSWGSLKSVFGNPKASFDSVSDKENQGLAMENQISSVSSLKSSSTTFKPVNRCKSEEKSKIKGVSVKGSEKIEVLGLKKEEIRDEKTIDEEIEEIESQIHRLTSRLDALKLEKAERGEKVVEMRGVEQKQSVKTAGDKKIGVEISDASGKLKVNRRGMSMGPSEIFGAMKIRQLGKQEIITPLQSRRKSCFWKLQDIEEERENVKSCSVSPRSRKLASKAQITTRQAVTTIGSRKTLKKEEVVMNSIQPKKLFKDGERSVPPTNKKPVRPGRVVASRYNQSSNQASAMRKRSLPENENDNSKRVEKKRSLSVGKTRANESENKNVGTESRVKKRWEVPNEIVDHGSVERKNSPQSIVDVPDMLPRLRIIRGVKESPRDSGPAKKVAELIGRKSFFNSDEDVEPSVCQALTYADEGFEDES